MIFRGEQAIGHTDLRDVVQNLRGGFGGNDSGGGCGGPPLVALVPSTVR